jgi:hypothetical protein
VMYLGLDAIAPKTAELFVVPAERHAWTAFVAALLALLVLYPRKGADPGSHDAARLQLPN